MTANCTLVTQLSCKSNVDSATNRLCRRATTIQYRVMQLAACRPVGVAERSASTCFSSHSKALLKALLPQRLRREVCRSGR